MAKNQKANQAEEAAVKEAAAEEAAAKAAEEEAARKAAEEADAKVAQAKVEAEKATLTAAAKRAEEESNLPKDVEAVIVTVPKRLVLRLTHHEVRVLEAGVQKVEKHVAEHWWSKVNGVKIFDPDAPIGEKQADAPKEGE